MATKFETQYENIEFSFVVRKENVYQTFDWGDECAELPWHQDLFQVSMRVYDTKVPTKCKICRFHFPCADWISPKEVRECAMQMIYNYVDFPETIGKDKELKKLCESTRAITKKTRDYMVGIHNGTVKQFA